MTVIKLSHLSEKSYLKNFHIKNSINQKLSFIKSNIHYGEPISKSKIPKFYKDEFDISNLFWVELSRFYRLLYSLTRVDSEIVVFVVDILDHKLYNKRFNYK